MGGLLLRCMWWVSAVETADYNSQVKEVNTNTLPRGIEQHYLSKANQHMQRLNASFYPSNFVQ